MQIKKRDAETVIGKFGLTRKSTHHKMYSFLHPETGEFVLGTRISYGRGEMRAPDKFRKQLNLTEDQLRDAIRCPFRLDDWVQLLKRKRVF